MTLSLPPRFAAPPKSVLRTVAVAALCATALLGAHTAQAGLIFTTTQRSVSADTSRTAPALLASSNPGLFTGTAVSQVPVDRGNGPSAAAAQTTTLEPLLFSGSGNATLNLFDNTGGEAESLLTVFFTLTTSFSFSGFADLSGSGNAPSQASFDLDLLGLGGVSVVSGNDTQPLWPYSGTLAPGDYSLNVRASSQSIDPNEAGNAAFNFQVAFTDLGSPPAAVPEPQALALALAGLLACGTTRRRQRQQQQQRKAAAPN